MHTNKICTSNGSSRLDEHFPSDLAGALCADNPFGAAQVMCKSLIPPLGSTFMSTQRFQAQGCEQCDVGSTIGVTPPVEKIIGLAEGILGL